MPRLPSWRRSATHGEIGLVIGDEYLAIKEHLRDLHDMFSAEDIPGIKKVEELEVA
jgi:hypothetical protein